jgi:polysaccharide transporter, PST family
MSISEKIKKIALLKNNDGLYKILANVFWLFADKILRMGCGVFITVWIARYLGVNQFGLLNYATAFVILLSPIANLGLDNIVVHQLTSKSSNKDEILGTTFYLKLLGGILSVVLAFVCILIIRPGDATSISVVTVLSIMGVLQAFDTIDLWFQSRVESKYTVIAKNTAFVFTSISKIALINIQAPLILFVWVSVAEIFLGSLGLVIFYRIQGFSIKMWRWSFSVAKFLFKEGLPLIFSSLAIMIYMKLDQIMLGEMIDDRAVGIYSAATRISEVWYFIPVSVASSVSPAIYKAKEMSEKIYYERIEKLNRWLVLLSIALAIPMTFFSTSIVVLCFGNSYVEAGNILAVHIWAAVFVFTGVATSAWFIVEKLNHLSMYKTLLGAIINVLLNLWLIPIYSGLGAAIATVVAYAFSGFIFHVIHPRTRQLFKLQMKLISFK